jgi:hypothetical protein
MEREERRQSMMGDLSNDGFGSDDGKQKELHSIALPYYITMHSIHFHLQSPLRDQRVAGRPA